MGVNIPSNGKPRLLLHDLINETQQTKETMEAKRWVYHDSNGQDVSYADTLLTMLNKYAGIVDITMQYSPSVVSMVWSGFRLLLQFATADMENVQMIFGSLESLVRILYRCDIYEKLYADRELQATKQLNSSLVDLYVAILEYLCSAKREIGLKTPARILKSLISNSGELFNKIQECEKDVLNDADTAEKEAAGVESDAQKERTRGLKMLLIELQEPIQKISRAVAQLSTYAETERRSKILMWLSVVPFKDHHTLSKLARRKGTGDWLLQNEKFWQWRNSRESSLFWLRGNGGCKCVPVVSPCIEADSGSREALAGSGKTILASKIIDEFLQVPGTASGRDALAYFYCYYGEESRKDAACILRALVKQLCLVDTGLPRPVLAVYKEREDSGHQSGSLLIDESRDLIIALSTGFTHTTIGSLLRTLRQIVTRTKHVRVFLTSRSDGEIEKILGNFPSHYLDAADNAGDINTFITTEIDRCSEERLLLGGHVDQALRSEIISILEDGAHGMFMWVHLQILAICLEHTAENVRIVLSNLPQGLDATYSRMLKIADTQSALTSNAVDMILKWILYAEGLCSPKLIIQALAVTPEKATLATSSWTLDTILHICHNFVVYDRTLEILRFAHFSVQEFLVRQPKFAAQEGHTTIGEICFTALTYTSESCPMPDLLKYSTLHWAAHLRLSGSGSRILTRLWKDFLTPNLPISPAFEAWGEHLQQVGSWQYHSLRTESGWVHPLWVACYYNLYEIFKYLLENGAAVDCRDKSKNTPLSHAASMGYIDFVRLLLEREDVDRNCRNLKGSTPLTLAASSNRGAVVKILLEIDGVELNARDNASNTPLSNASMKGHEEVVQLLIEMEGLELDAKDGRGMTSLAHAAEFGSATVVHLLLEKGVDPTLVCTKGRTALWYALKAHSKPIVEELLEIGLEPDLPGKDGRTPLSHVAEWGSATLASILFETGKVGVNSQDAMGQTPLSFAARHRLDTMVRLFLEQGADPGLPDNQGKTPLYFASECGHEQIVKILLEKGANPNSGTSDGVTPLQIATAYGREEVARVLLEEGGADPYSLSNEGWTPLTLAAGSNHIAVLRVFLKQARVDPDFPDGKGRTALSRAAQDHRKHIVEILQVLLETEGVNPDSRDHEGRTPLSYAAKYSSFETVLRMLLTKGVDVNSRDNVGRTPISYPTSWNWQIALPILLENEADRDTIDNAGRTPLSYAAESSEEGHVKMLLESGVDLNSQDNIGRSPLSYATSNGAGLVQILLEKGADPNLRDKGGKTPLRHAIKRGCEEAARILLTNGGADPYSEDNEGWTPLTYAAASGQHAILRMMIEEGGIDPEFQDNLQRTALIYAVVNGQAEAITVLLDNGANANLKDINGHDALSAAEASTEKIKQMLLKQ